MVYRCSGTWWTPYLCVKQLNKGAFHAMERGVCHVAAA
jgi:hypothetical protein